VAPGKRADVVLVDDLTDFRCHQVWTNGTLTARDGEPVAGWKTFHCPPEAHRSVASQKVGGEFFATKPPADRAKVRVVEIVSDTITRESIEPIGESGGMGFPDVHRDILKVAVMDKGRRRAVPSISFLKGVGFRAGALATSLIWDTNNIMVVGVSDEEMSMALNRLIDLGGGVVVCRGHEVIAELPLPICGVISPEPLEVVSRQIRAVEDACHRLGSSLQRPLLTFQTVPFTGLPYLRPTDKGLADIRKGKLVPLWV
jgi:adenine deaminase